MRLSDERYASEVHGYDGSREDDLYPWYLSVEEVMGEEEVSDPPTNERVAVENTNEALPLITSAIGDQTLRAI